MRLSITSTFEIAAEHHLPYHQGKCHRVHGHNYRLEFTKYGTPADLKKQTFAHLQEELSNVHYPPSDEGMLEDFSDFDAEIKAVLEYVDHYSLNDLMPNPTAEYFALWLAERLPWVDKIVVWETGRHCATVERERED